MFSDNEQWSFMFQLSEDYSKISGVLFPEIDLTLDSFLFVCNGFHYSVYHKRNFNHSQISEIDIYKLERIQPTPSAWMNMTAHIFDLAHVFIMVLISIQLKMHKEQCYSS